MGREETEERKRIVLQANKDWGDHHHHPLLMLLLLVQTSLTCALSTGFSATIVIMKPIGKSYYLNISPITLTLLWISIISFHVNQHTWYPCFSGSSFPNKKQNTLNFDNKTWFFKMTSTVIITLCMKQNWNEIKASLDFAGLKWFLHHSSAIEMFECSKTVLLLTLYLTRWASPHYAQRFRAIKAST